MQERFRDRPVTTIDFVLLYIFMIVFLVALAIGLMSVFTLLGGPPFIKRLFS